MDAHIFRFERFFDIKSFFMKAYFMGAHEKVVDMIFRVHPLCIAAGIPLIKLSKT